MTRGWRRFFTAYMCLIAVYATVFLRTSYGG